MIRVPYNLEGVPITGQEQGYLLSSTVKGTDTTNAFHNGAESSMIETDLVNGDLLARTTLSADGLAFDTHDYDYFLNHYNTQNWFDAIGIKLRADGISLQVFDVKDRDWFYNEMTPEQFDGLTNWSGGTSVEILYDAGGEVVTDSNGETIFTLPEV